MELKLYVVITSPSVPSETRGFVHCQPYF